MATDLPLGTGAIVVILVYLASTILIGWAGRMAAREKTLADFFLAGRNMGVFTLLMTLFATQYSGNSFIGFPGQTYRIGYSFLYGVVAMQAIVVFYLTYAPGLKRAARKAGFITPADFLDHRYRSRALHLLSTIIMIYALGNFVLAQMKAMGHLLTGVTGGRVPFAAGVVFLALIMVIYETLGGMRSVAWTDVLQGVMLFTGVAAVFFLILPETGGMAAITEQVARIDPQKTSVPSGNMLRTWVSTILLVGIGGSIYPQAIQRIYAARNVTTLKKSLSVMVCLPLVTTTFTVLLGLTALILHPGLQGGETDRAMPLLLATLMQSSTLAYWLVVGVMAAALAAIMSTADSGLLSLSSMFTRDLVARYLVTDRPEAWYHRAGKIASWGIVAVLCLLAIFTPATIWRLLEIKFEILIQVFPAFVLGVRRKGPGSGPVLAGLVAGCLVAVGMLIAGQSRIWGFHVGLYGLAANLLVVWAIRALGGPGKATAMRSGGSA